VGGLLAPTQELASSSEREQTLDSPRRATVTVRWRGSPCGLPNPRQRAQPVASRRGPSEARDGASLDQQRSWRLEQVEPGYQPQQPAEIVPVGDATRRVRCAPISGRRPHAGVSSAQATFGVCGARRSAPRAADCGIAARGEHIGEPRVHHPTSFPSRRSTGYRRWRRSTASLGHALIQLQRRRLRSHAHHPRSPSRRGRGERGGGRCLLACYVYADGGQSLLGPGSNASTSGERSRDVRSCMRRASASSALTSWVSSSANTMLANGERITPAIAAAIPISAHVPPQRGKYRPKSRPRGAEHQQGARIPPAGIGPEARIDQTPSLTTRSTASAPSASCPASCSPIVS